MGIGVWQIILILVIILIIFGAGKLPRVMGDVAKGIKNFKQGMKDDDTGVSSPEAISSEKSAQASTVENKKDTTSS